MANLPCGTVTFLFTDIEGSTALWERDRAAMAAAVERHLALLRAAIEAHDGVLFKTVGDAVQAAFPTAPDAVAAALDAQRALLAETWPERSDRCGCGWRSIPGPPTPQRRGLPRSGLNRCRASWRPATAARSSSPWPTQELARDALPAGASLRDLGEHPLRDLLPTRSGSSSSCIPTCRPTSRRSGRWPPAPTTCPCNRPRFSAGRSRWRRSSTSCGRDDVRLLTLTGPGGVGKTRLALQAAADLLEDFPDGVWFVDLSVLADPALVPSAIAGVLGVREEGSELTERLASVLGGKRLLLVLDNFEHVVDAAQIGRRSARPCPGSEGAGHQPHAAARLRRAGVPAAAARRCPTRPICRRSSS